MPVAAPPARSEGSAMLIQQVLLFFWLGASHAIAFSIAGMLFESGHPWIGASVFVGVPAWRLYRRFREPKGYYLLGYLGEVGGDRWERGGWISRQRNRSQFALCLASEIFVIAFLGFMTVFHPPGA
jgi:hypothetical protein